MLVKDGCMLVRSSVALGIFGQDAIPARQGLWYF
jgi:hypothetical protein